MLGLQFLHNHDIVYRYQTQYFFNSFLAVQNLIMAEEKANILLRVHRVLSDPYSYV